MNKFNSRSILNVDPKKIIIKNGTNKSFFKVNIGSGVRDWPNWICFDEIENDHITKINFTKESKFPILDKSVSLFYSSHFFEHISDEVVEQILRETKRTSQKNSLFVLKIPDFSWFLRQYKFLIEDCMEDKELHAIIWSWKAKEIKQNLENKISTMFLSYYNKQYGDHFSGKINKNNNRAYFGPVKIDVEILKKILLLESPHEISKKLKKYSEWNDIKKFNHQNAWSDQEIIDLFLMYDFKLLHNSGFYIRNQFKEIIPDIDDMHQWSSFYLFKFDK